MSGHKWIEINHDERQIEWCANCGTFRKRYPLETEPWEYLAPGTPLHEEDAGGWPYAMTKEKPACVPVPRPRKKVSFEKCRHADADRMRENGYEWCLDCGGTRLLHKIAPDGSREYGEWGKP